MNQLLNVLLKCVHLALTFPLNAPVSLPVLFPTDTSGSTWPKSRAAKSSKWKYRGLSYIWDSHKTYPELQMYLGIHHCVWQSYQGDNNLFWILSVPVPLSSGKSFSVLWPHGKASAWSLTSFLLFHAKFIHLLLWLTLCKVEMLLESFLLLCLGQLLRPTLIISTFHSHSFCRAQQATVSGHNSWNCHVYSLNFSAVSFHWPVEQALPVLAAG
jgi:hypothetical protein